MSEYIIIYKLIHKLVNKFEPINGTLLFITIKRKIFDIIIINCHAPTETTDSD